MTRIFARLFPKWEVQRTDEVVLTAQHWLTKRTREFPGVLEWQKDRRTGREQAVFRSPGMVQKMRIAEACELLLKQDPGTPIYLNRWYAFEKEAA